MTEYAKNCTSTIIPGMRYRDAARAIDWLCSALGFQKHAAYPNPDGTIAHAELTFGNGMIMLGSVSPEPAGLMKQPDEIGRANTVGVSLVSSNPDAIYALAKAEGAEIVLDIEDKPYGGRGFSCRDPEGHLWHVYSYDPWSHQPE